MTEQECLAKMVAPGTPREGKYRRGVIQINVTSACNLSCFNCTQGSNYAGPKHVMTPEQFEQAVQSLGFSSYYQDCKWYPDATNAYFGVVGVFGGNPALSPHFEAYCDVLKRLVPFNRRGLWCNSPRGKGRIMRETFDPSVSNINVHLDKEAAAEFRRDWPEARIVGEHEDSRHSPVFVAMKDVIRKQCPKGGINCCEEGCECDMRSTVPDESRIFDLISTCDINQHWSAMIGMFRGELRAWFCEVAGAQAMLHQDEDGYPDTGYDLVRTISVTGDTVKRPEYSFNPSQLRQVPWWKLPMHQFRDQVRKHCFDCGVPLRGYGELAQSNDVGAVEQISETHAGIARPKHKDRAVEVVKDLVQLGTKRVGTVTHYMQNARS